MAKSKTWIRTLPPDERGRAAFFAAANSTEGFFCRYDEIFGGDAEVYIIKGGPGTGKSRLLRDMVAAGERVGFAAQLYYCSSDPTSLDGIILTHGSGRRKIFLDGTPPHTVEPTLPGVREQLIDPGAFWSRARLLAREGEIRALSAQKQLCYAEAYRYLKAAGACAATAEQWLLPQIDGVALSRLTQRLLSGIGTTGGGGASAHVFTSCLGMRGWGRLATLETAAERICRLQPLHGAERAVVAAVAEESRRRGIPSVVSYPPVCPRLPDGIYFPQERALITACPVPDATVVPPTARYTRSISLRALISPERLRAVRGQLRRAASMREALLTCAEQAMLAAGEAHFSLEEIYGSAMDFAAKEQYVAQLAERIFADV